MGRVLTRHHWTLNHLPATNGSWPSKQASSIKILPTGQGLGLRCYTSWSMSQSLMVSPSHQSHCPLHLTISDQTESIEFFVTSVTNSPVILGHPWILQHNSLIFCNSNYILQWGLNCLELCLVAVEGTCSRVSDGLDVHHHAIPEKYWDLVGISSKTITPMTWPSSSCWARAPAISSSSLLLRPELSKNMSLRPSVMVPFNPVHPQQLQGFSLLTLVVSAPKISTSLSSTMVCGTGSCWLSNGLWRNGITGSRATVI